jgi:hypothetical protein
MRLIPVGKTLTAIIDGARRSSTSGASLRAAHEAAASIAAAAAGMFQADRFAPAAVPWAAAGRPRRRRIEAIFDRARPDEARRIRTSSASAMQRVSSLFPSLTQSIARR